MRAALIVGLVTLLAVARGEPEAGGERQERMPPVVSPGVCPQDEGCIAAGGECFRDVLDFSPECDYVLDDRALCGGNCKCCINCAGSCGDSDSGTCTAEECVTGEFTAGNCGETPCTCCEPCEASTCESGRCAGPDTCDADEYVAGVCGLGNCTCCADCEPDDTCSDAGGVCVNVNSDCPDGLSFYSSGGCNDGNCKCCAQCIPGNNCETRRNPGRCVINDMLCSGEDEYTTGESCGSDASCTCCKTCQPKQNCADNGGTCYNKNTYPAMDGYCPPGYERRYGCKTNNCVCCVRNNE